MDEQINPEKGFHDAIENPGEAPARREPKTAAARWERGNGRRVVLPDPSPEQSDIIRAVNDGKCVTIRACAGSGKTTCMLQVAASLPERRRALVVTYNRSLADECRGRIRELRASLANRVECYTIHGLASRFAGSVCNDDHKLMRQLDRWESGLDDENHPAANWAGIMPLDLVMIDEAQDLRPLFHGILSHIFRIAASGGGMQICLVGDPRQMLYDFPTYGDDKASTSFFLQPESYWGRFSKERTWVHLPLSVSYRLTPNMASFCNLFWGTSMVGGNTASPNVPVEYLIKYPYPNTRGTDNPEKLKPSFLAKIIDEHGPENVMFLAQSVKNESSPIRVHVNELMKLKDTNGLQKYNFHIKENVRGFEGTPDWKNKVRVWTFCGSKGCEADVVIVFGLDLYRRVHSLNQVGVALSRARKRLLVIHSKKYVGKECLALPFYPVLGDSPSGMDRHIVRHGRDNSECIDLNIPDMEPQSNPGSSIGKNYASRCELTKTALAKLAESGVVALGHDSSFSDSIMPETARDSSQKPTSQVYVATDFGYFSASAETRFLKYGTWTKSHICDETKNENIVIEGGDASPLGRIEYETNVQFATTTEDVSALYGEAVVYMLQWELCHFVPNIETIVSNGMLRLDPHVQYSADDIRKSLQSMGCEDLTPKDNERLTKEFAGESNKRIKGKDLIPFINKRMDIRKKRKKKKQGSAVEGEEITFPVKAGERKKSDDDDQLTEFLPQIKLVYESENIEKKPFHWIYLANAVMAFSNYHEKFRQIGTNLNSYEHWVNSEALFRGLERLRTLMKTISPYNQENRVGANAFEQELSVDFAKQDCIFEQNDPNTIVGVAGVCDWINKKRAWDVKRGKEESVHGIDLLEIKFVHHLSNIHRLQVLVYTALYALKVNKVKKRNCDDCDNNLNSFDKDETTRLDINYWDTSSDDSCDSHSDKEKCNDKNDQQEWKVEYARGMLYNARTGEQEFCTIKSRNAMEFLLDISQFKYNGKDRKLLGGQKVILPKEEIKREKDSVSAPENCRSSSHKGCIPKRRFKKNTGKTYHEPNCVGNFSGDLATSVPAVTISADTKTPRGYCSVKRAKKRPRATPGEGTKNDPIVLD